MKLRCILFSATLTSGGVRKRLSAVGLPAFTLKCEGTEKQSGCYTSYPHVTQRRCSFVRALTRDLQYVLSTELNPSCDLPPRRSTEDSNLDPVLTAVKAP